MCYMDVIDTKLTTDISTEMKGRYTTPSKMNNFKQHHPYPIKYDGL